MNTSLHNAPPPRGEQGKARLAPTCNNPVNPEILKIGVQTIYKKNPPPPPRPQAINERPQPQVAPLACASGGGKGASTQAA